MAIVKRLNTSYTIDSTDVYILGNLVVQGAQTSITTVDTVIKDKLIVLNSGETGAGIGGGSQAAGIQFDRGTLPSAYFVYFEPTGTFSVSYDGGSTFVNVVTTSSAVTTVLSDIVFDLSPQLGGNLDVQQYSIFTSNTTTKNVTIAGNLQLNNATAEPTAVGNASVVYAASPAGGATGVFVVNQQVANQELVSKARAIGLSLLL